MESSSNFKHFQKKEGCHSQCITKFNDCQILGYSIFEKPSSQKFFWKSTCERVSNNCEIWFRALLSYYLITLRINDLEHISLIEISNIRGVCYPIDSQWQVSCSGLWEFPIRYSKEILKKKNIFWISCVFFGIIIKF